ncbi:MAG: hypothetical protein JWO82_3806 [Akkermansiaceae bacterium]|nr:hypothetical protein [Akkermansiaceae bacterium]
MKAFIRSHVISRSSCRRFASQRVAPLFAVLTGSLLLSFRAGAEIQVLDWYRMGEGVEEPAQNDPFTLKDETGRRPLTATPACGFSPVISPEAAARTGSTRALRMNGQGAVASGSLLTGVNDNFGIEAWIATDTNSGDRRILYNGEPGKDGWGIEQSGNYLRLRVGSSVSYGTWVGPGGWNHVALVVDRGRISMYLNRVLAGSLLNVVVLPATGNFRIGDSEKGFPGRVDEVRAFTFAPGAFRFADLLPGKFPVTLMLNGGSVPYGSSLDQGTGEVGVLRSVSNFFLRNLDPVALPLASVGVTGGDTGDFEVTGWDGSPLPEGRLDSSGIPLAVAFTPRGGGLRSTTLRVVSADPAQGEFSVQLTGTGLLLPSLEFYAGKGAVLKPVGGVAEIFPLIPAGGKRVVKSYTVRNAGSADLTGLALSFSGMNAADFTAGALPESLAPGESASFDVTFMPGLGGARRAKLRLVSNDQDRPEVTLDLVGQGVGPEIDITRGAGERPAAGALLEISGYGSPSDMPEGLHGVVSAAAGFSFGVAARADGTVAAWGPNGYSGQIEVPPGLSGVVAVAAGADSALALKGDGTVVQWGGGSAPEGLSGITAISAGDSAAIALKRDGTVVTWRWGFSAPDSPPVGLGGVVAVAAGESHKLALKDDGTVVAWGNNHWEQSQVPAGLAGVVAVAAGGNHSLALESDGTLVQWGNCGSIVPPGISGPVAEIAANGAGYVALLRDGRLIRWSGDDGVVSKVVDTGGATVRGIASGISGNFAIVDHPADFGVRDVAAAALRQSFTIRNGGGLPLKLSSLEISGENADAFTLDTRGTLMTLPGTQGVTTFTVSFRPRAEGMSHATLRVLSNDEDEGVYEIPLTGGGVVVTGPLEAWRLLHFETTADAGSAADLADPNHNGITNLLEYALGGDPVAGGGGASLLPKYVVNRITKRSSLVVARDSSRAGIVMTVQAADDPAGPWQDLATSTNSGPFKALSAGTGIVESGIGTKLNVAVTDPVRGGDGGRTRRFMRLRVTRL